VREGANQLLVGLDELAVADVQVDCMDVVEIRQLHRTCQRHHVVAHRLARRFLSSTFSWGSKGTRFKSRLDYFVLNDQIKTPKIR